MDTDARNVTLSQHLDDRLVAAIARIEKAVVSIFTEVI